MSPKQLHEEVFHVNKSKFMLQKKKKHSYSKMSLISSKNVHHITKNNLKEI